MRVVPGRAFLIGIFDYLSQVLLLLALTNVTLAFKENSPLILLQESHMGTILSPDTASLKTCAPNVGASVHPLTEQVLGHDLPEKLSQCCFQLPHRQARTPVPFLFFHPVVGKIAISNHPFYCCILLFLILYYNRVDVKYERCNVCVM